MKGKRIGTSVLAALMLAGTTATSALAAMPDQTAVLGEKAFSLKYVNASENETEIREAIKETMKAGKKIYVKARNVWYNNDESKLADTSVIPAVVYKTADSEVSYEAGDGEEATEGFAIKEISATNVREITVSFTEAVSKEDQEKASFVVTKGKATLTQSKVEFNEEGTEAVISLASKIITAEYAVVVKGLEVEDNKRTFAGEKEGIEAVVVTTEDKVPQVPQYKYDANDKTYKVDGYKAYLNYEVQNQYGKKHSSVKSVMAYGPYGLSESFTGGKIEIDLPDAGVINHFVKEIPLSVTLTAGTGADVITKLYAGNIVEDAKIKDAEFAKLFKNKDEELVEIEAVAEGDNSEVYIALNLTDQYGNKIGKGFLANSGIDLDSLATITDAAEREAKTRVALNAVTEFGNFSVVLSSQLDKQIVDNPNDDNDDTVYIKLKGKFDTIVPTSLTMVAGKDVNRLNVAVNESTIIDQYNIETPDLMAAGDEAEITVEAFDKAGDQLSDKALFDKLTTFKVAQKDANDKVVLDSKGEIVMIPATGGVVNPDMLKPSVGNLVAEYDYVTEKMTVTWTFPKSANAGSYDITVTLVTATQNHKYDTILKQLKPQVRANEIALSEKKLSLMTTGAEQTFSVKKNVDIFDQYGRKMKTNDEINAKITIADNTAVVANGDGTWTFKGIKKTGTTNATITLQVDSKTSSALDIAIKTIKTDEVKSLHLDVDGTMYIGKKDRKGGHDAGVEVYGKTANGAKVVLASTDYSMQSNIAVSYKDSSDAKIDAGIAVSGSKVTIAKAIPDDKKPFGDDKEKTFTIYAASTNLSNASNVPTADIKLSIAAPKLTEIKVDEDKTVVSSEDALVTVGDLLENFVILKDQYGVTMKTAAVKAVEASKGVKAVTGVTFDVDKAAMPSLVIVQKAKVAKDVNKEVFTGELTLGQRLFDGALENGNNYEVKMFFGQKNITFKVVVDK